MNKLAHLDPFVPKLVIAALLILARSYLQHFGLVCPSVTEILKKTQASRSRAYEIAETLNRLLSSLIGSPGRPKSAPPPDTPDVYFATISQKVLQFVMMNPGCVDRRYYSDGFIRIILKLREQHQSTSLDSFAKAVNVPKRTLEDWFRNKPASLETASPSPPKDSESDLTSAHIMSIVDHWHRWRGRFGAFCEQLRHRMRINYSNQTIGRILYAHGERCPKRRKGRSPDEIATRGSFETFFPGAQWVGDGMTVPVVINNHRFDFNLELNVDAYSGAIVGMSVRNEEDSAAVIEAFEDGVTTTGSPPVALLLDNRLSNHTNKIDEAIGDTLLMNSTPGRAQNKAHVEGAFGLFSQETPPIMLKASHLSELAQKILCLLATTWVRSVNHRSRADRNGRSRAQIYSGNQPSPETILQTIQTLKQRMKNAEKARATRESRANPTVCDILNKAFERLELDDPNHHIRKAISRYSLDNIVDAIAVFDGKKNSRTLPPDVSARYLLGIVRNVAHTHESDQITLSLMRERIAAHDALLSPLLHLRNDLIRTEIHPPDIINAFIAQAMTSDRTIDSLFWLTSAADIIKPHNKDKQQELFRFAAKRIHSSFRQSRQKRYYAERSLARQVWPAS